MKQLKNHLRALLLLVLAAVGIAAHAITITVTGNVSENQYANRTDITEVILNNSSTVVIGANAFFGCKNLTTLTNRSTANVNVNTLAFGETGITKADLKNFVFVNNAEGIFMNCTSLNSIDMSNMKDYSLCKNLFYGCTKLTDVTLSKIEKIGEGAFMNTGITKVTIPSNIKEIGGSAFNTVTEVTLYTTNFTPSGRTQAKAKLSDIFGKLTIMSLASNVTSVPEGFAEGITTLYTVNSAASELGVNKRAFAGCTSLISVPRNITQVYAYAFADCRGISAFVAEKGATIDAFAFCGTRLAMLEAASYLKLNTNALSGISASNIMITVPETYQIKSSALNGVSGNVTFTADNVSYTVEDKAFSGFSGTVTTPDVKSFNAGAFSGFKGSLVVGGQATEGKYVKNGIVRFYDSGNVITLSGGETIDAASSEGFVPAVLDLRNISAAVTVNDKGSATTPLASMVIVDGKGAKLAKDLADTGSVIVESGTTGDLNGDGNLSIADVTNLVHQLLHPESESISGTSTYVDRLGNEYEVKWLQMWEDGPKFAEHNIRSSSPASHGFYGAWGGTTNPYSYASGANDLSGENDNATYLWGDNWRLPTKGEFEGLMAHCDLVLDRNYEGSGVRVLKFTGRGDYAENVLILPCSGYDPTLGTSGEQYVNQMAYYLTSTANGTEASYFFSYWDADDNGVVSGTRRCMASVRPVLK